jgi:fumarate reductase flavoprotein subunit
VSAAVLAQGRDEEKRLQNDFLHRSDGHERIATIRDDMQKAMEESAGIYRTGDSLQRGVEALRALRERFADIAIEDRSHTFNTERTTALELSFMLDVADAIVNSALQRQESRGAHQRIDFPARDDQRFLAHSLIHRKPDGSSRIEYLPVTLTRWPPAERVYGR